jgi:hypothetical protein
MDGEPQPRRARRTTDSPRGLGHAAGVCGVSERMKLHYAPEEIPVLDMQAADRRQKCAFRLPPREEAQVVSRHVGLMSASRLRLEQCVHALQRLGQLRASLPRPSLGNAVCGL